MLLETFARVSSREQKTTVELIKSSATRVKKRKKDSSALLIVIIPSECAFGMEELRRGSIVNFFDRFRLRSESLPGWLPLHGNSTLFTPIGGDVSHVPRGDSIGLQRLTRESPVSIEDTLTSNDVKTLSLCRKMESDSEGFSPKTHYTVVPMNGTEEGRKRLLSTRRGNDALGIVLSALYGKMLVVMGIAFPMSEVISTYIPPSFYDGFYLYLYFGSISFMVCVYGNILRQKATHSVRVTLNSEPPRISIDTSTVLGRRGLMGLRFQRV